jgi:hypothetical protein
MNKTSSNKNGYKGSKPKAATKPNKSSRKPLTESGMIKMIRSDDDPIETKKLLVKWASAKYPEFQSVFRDDRYELNPRPTREEVRAQIMDATTRDEDEYFPGAVIVRPSKRSADVQVLDETYGSESEVEDEPVIETPQLERGRRGKKKKGARAERQRAEAAAAARAGRAETAVGVSEETVNKIYEKMMERYMTERNGLRAKKINIFNELYNLLNGTLQENVDKDSRYVKIYADKCVLELWKLTKELMACGTYTDQVDRIIDVRTEWETLFMGDDETLEHFKEKVENMMQRMKYAGLEDYRQEEIAASFVRKLNYKFEEFKVVEANRGGLYAGRKYRTLLEAYNAADQYQNTPAVMRMIGNRRSYREQNRGVAHGTAFKSMGHKTGDGGVQLCYTCNGKGHKANMCTSEEGWDITCFNCGGTGHVATNCPSE